MKKLLLTIPFLFFANNAYAIDNNDVCVTMGNIAGNTARKRDEGVELKDIITAIYATNMNNETRQIVATIIIKAYELGMHPATTAIIFYDFCMEEEV